MQSGQGFESAGAPLDVTLQPIGGNAFDVVIRGDGLDLAGTTLPLTVRMIVGDDGGTTTLDQGAAVWKSR